MGLVAKALFNIGCDKRLPRKLLLKGQSGESRKSREIFHFENYFVQSHVFFVFGKVCTTHHCRFKGLWLYMFKLNSNGPSDQKGLQFPKADP